MIDFGERDPEEVGEEHEEDTELRLRTARSRHEFSKGPDGRCDDVMERRDGSYRRCGLEGHSVMHIDERSDRHDHGGGDCMCFEANEDQY